MDKLKKILSLVIFVPLGIILIVLAVANRQTVTLALNPFRPEDSVLSVSAPFFLFLLLAVLLGMLIGAAVTWWSQGRHRKQARVEAREAARWQNEHKAVVAGRPASQQLASK
ncbi:lipopolysaccharide assembly protein LapA domain-containing protein [Neorhizobium alkalisoli]|uniref:lipopolysaccharide assembly protein LapA domain-containing protein n=1 Tax=Neorhizobium alkalisoli TaxID=528178 RepID=UPI000CF9F153|nr:lipopolysaccharide assembly protein LapA domain-containing protein [Neorhizobium alkalisoli]